MPQDRILRHRRLNGLDESLGVVPLRLSDQHEATTDVGSDHLGQLASGPLHRFAVGEQHGREPSSGVLETP